MRDLLSLVGPILPDGCHAVHCAQFVDPVGLNRAIDDEEPPVDVRIAKAPRF